MKTLITQLKRQLNESDSKTTEPRWQDDDGDGIWYEPEDVNEADEEGSVSTDDPREAERLAKQGLNVDLKDDMDEMSTTAGVPAPLHKFAFSKKDKKSKETYPGVSEEIERRYEKILESSYREFATSDPKTSPERKVKGAIKEVSKRLSEVENIVKHTSRLKTESGISKDNYGPSIQKALTKISERLIKISERVRSLGE